VAWCGGKDAFGRGIIDAVSLKKGAIYVIRHIETWGNMIGFCLDGVYNRPVFNSLHEPVYDHSHFRPIIDRDTDIAVFEKLLVDSDEVVV
jgi:hypothetical protein